MAAPECPWKAPLTWMRGEWVVTPWPLMMVNLAGFPADLQLLGGDVPVLNLLLRAVVDALLLQGLIDGGSHRASFWPANMSPSAINVSLFFWLSSVYAATFMKVLLTIGIFNVHRRLGLQRLGISIWAISSVVAFTIAGSWLTPFLTS